MAKHQGKNLYQRLGGYDVIAGIIDDLYVRMRADSRLQRFSAGRSVDSKNRTRQLFVDQICALSGGPCIYIGRDMKTSHAGLGINENEWRIVMQYTATALDKFKIKSKEKKEFLAIFESYKQDIVE